MSKRLKPRARDAPNIIKTTMGIHKRGETNLQSGILKTRDAPKS